MITDIDGFYMITVPDGQTTLEYRFMGYEARTVKVGNQTTINVSLEEATSSLEEVVVVAYGAQKKVTMTGRKSEQRPARQGGRYHLRAIQR